MTESVSSAGCRVDAYSSGIRISDEEFALYQGLIHNIAGVYLGPAKKAFLVGRLGKRLRTLGLKSFRDYHGRITQGDDQELQDFLDCVLTNETRFFRERSQFEFLEQTILPEWQREAAMQKRQKLIRIWSAACSSGEEPYSIAMSLLHHFPLSSGWRIEILATDLSNRVLNKARTALWRIEQAADIPNDYLKQFMLKGKGARAGYMKAGPKLRSLIDFQRLNLNAGAYRGLGNFDLVFCRNVLIYFDAKGKLRVVHQLLKHLSATGYLFLGHAETLHGSVEQMHSPKPSIYTRRP